ncbi:MAG: LCP family protein [Halanaerobiales bacterium]
MEKGESNKKKVYIAIAIALLLLAIGFYFYYFYPQVIPGMASPSLNQDISILVVGVDDTESVSKGEISADSIILVELYSDSDKIKLTNIIMDEERSFGETVEKEEVATLLEDLSEMTSTAPNYYFTLSYQGFINIVDNLGGLEIQREEELNIPDLNLDLKAGTNQLSGQEALNYARWYDYRTDRMERVERQRQIINALVDKGLRDKTLTDVPQLFTTTVDTFKSVKTNLELSTITDVVEFLMSNENINVSYDSIIINDNQE